MHVDQTYWAPIYVQDDASDDCGQIEDQNDDTDGEDDVVSDDQLHKPDGRTVPGRRQRIVGRLVIGQQVSPPRYVSMCRSLVCQRQQQQY